MNKKLLAIFALISLGCSAQAQEAKQQETKLKEVTVTATRVETDSDAVSATVTTLDRETLDRRLPRDEADLFRDEPDVAVARDARRFGATRVNIRGLEDVRVVQMVDGVRLPDFYNGGGPPHTRWQAALFHVMKILAAFRSMATPPIELKYRASKY